MGMLRMRARNRSVDSIWFLRSATLQHNYVDSSISQRVSFNVSGIVTPFRCLLAVGETKRGGLILCKPHYAEFAGPGAAIACLTTPGYSFIVAIGAPDLIEVIDPSDRQRAYSRRIQWVRWLQKIVLHADPVQRAEKLFLGFEEFFSGEVVSQIPDEILALLAGVLPQTIAAVRSQNRYFGSSDSFNSANLSKAASSIVILDGQTLQPIKAYPSTEQKQSIRSSTLTELSRFPQSA
jgi:hypothetical protein